jgi:hypothetical protein
MDNGLEVLAKLPNPIARPAYFTTASEVATREFVSTSIPKPKNPNLTLLATRCIRIFLLIVSLPGLLIQTIQLVQNTS